MKSQLDDGGKNGLVTEGINIPGKGKADLFRASTSLI
jgi:hypothetical protein